MTKLWVIYVWRVKRFSDSHSNCLQLNEHSEKDAFYLKELTAVTRKMFSSLGQDIFGVVLLGLTAWYKPEINNEYSKRCMDCSHTHNFWYLYAFTLILISYSYYSYSKFEILIVLILNNTHDVIDFNYLLLNICKNHKLSMIRIRTLQYSVEGCLFVFFLNDLMNDLKYSNHLWVRVS